MNPGNTAATGNPSTGAFVIMDLLSGPKGSPKDTDPSGKASTGALSTGIGFGATQVIGPTAPASIKAAGFTDDTVPGAAKLDGTATTNATYMYIGGGRSVTSGSPNYSNPAGVAGCSPYTAGYGIGGFGNGGSRDAGAGPAFTGFSLKMVTATGAVATGAAVETGFLNRSGVALVSGQSVFGSSNTASAAVA